MLCVGVVGKGVRVECDVAEGFAGVVERSHLDGLVCVTFVSVRRDGRRSLRNFRRRVLGRLSFSDFRSMASYTALSSQVWFATNAIFCPQPITFKMINHSAMSSPSTLQTT
jgi:hypothetical protein